MGTALFDIDTVQLARFDQSMVQVGWFDNDFIVAADDFVPPAYLGVINSQETQIYYGGPYFVPNGAVIEFARYQAVNQIAALGCIFGSGRVFLSGIHAEMLTDNSSNASDANQKWLRYALAWVMGANNRTTQMIIYNESSEVYAPSVSGMQTFLTTLNIPWVTMTAAQINSTNLSAYRGIVMPGGLGVGTSTDTAGRTSIWNLINNGGVYIGICSGAYAAAATAVWEGDTISGLGIFDGQAIGSIGAISSWPGEVETTITQSKPQARCKKTGSGAIMIDPYRVAHMDGVYYKTLGENSDGLLVET